jgi:hypothetical protein
MALVRSRIMSNAWLPSIRGRGLNPPNSHDLYTWARTQIAAPPLLQLCLNGRHEEVVPLHGA